MLVNSISSFSTNKVAALKTKRNENCVENTSFTGLSMSPTHKKISLPLAAALMLAALGLGSLATSCNNGVTPTPGNEVPQPTPPTPPTPPTVTQSPVQKTMISAAEALGLLPATDSTADIKSFTYYNEAEDTTRILSLNTTESSDNELVYDGTAIDSYTTNYIRQKITQVNGGIMVKEYMTSDGNPISATSVFNSPANNKYILDTNTGCVNKYSLNSDGSIKKLLATISPDSTTSLLVTTPTDDTYQLTGISITTK